MAARGTFGNHKLPGFLGNFLSFKIKNVANTNIIYWGRKLLALWEGGLPYQLDPKTLHTDPEEFTLGGLLKKGDALTSHPRVDGKKNRLVAFSSKQDSMKEASVRIFEFDQSLSPVAERTLAIQGESNLLCYAMLCYAMLRYAMLYYTMLCYAILYYAMLCYAMLCYAMLRYAMLCYTIQCYTMLYYTMLCCAMLCHAMLCYAMLCYAMLCYAMLYYDMLCYAILCYDILCDK